MKTLGFPDADSRMVTEDGSITEPWHRLLSGMWKRLGGSFLQDGNAAFIEQTSIDAGAPLTVKSAVTGQPIGGLVITTGTGGPAQPQVLGASPFIFTAATSGVLVVFGAQVELSRNGITFYPVGLTGGSPLVLVGDKIRVTWFTAQAPTVTFFPFN